MYARFRKNRRRVFSVYPRSGPQQEALREQLQMKQQLFSVSSGYQDDPAVRMNEK